MLAILAATVLVPSAASAAESNLSYGGGPESHSSAPYLLAPDAGAATAVELSSPGGPVVHSSAPYLVFWTPSGESIPVRSRALMVRYFTDVAADSGKASNVFGVLRQYYDHTGFADYRQTFDPRRQVIIDRQPYPQRDPIACPYDSVPTWHPAYAACISEGQIQSELERLITADRLPTAGSRRAAFPGQGSPIPGMGVSRASIGGRLSANAPIYFVVVPTNVELCQILGTICSATQMAAYHNFFIDAQGSVVLFAGISMDPLAAWPIPPPVSGGCDFSGTGVNQEPNGDYQGDCVMPRLSHEDSETITDPLSFGGWWTPGSAGGVITESGDLCGQTGPSDPAKGTDPFAYLPTLGGSKTAGTLYTQLINGHRYYTQSEWSNGNGNCEMRPTPGRIVPRFTAPPRAVKVGRSLRFDPAASRSRNSLSSATWQFGDRSPTTFFSASATLTSVEHRYRKRGRYTVTLTLVDSKGNLETTTRHVTVGRR